MITQNQLDANAFERKTTRRDRAGFAGDQTRFARDQASSQAAGKSLRETGKGTSSKPFGVLKKTINNDNNSKKNIEKPLTKGDPKYSFFKQVYYRFYNFSIQSFSHIPKGKIQLEFNKPVTQIFTLRNTADLLGNMYLHLRLPKIITNDEHKLSYVKNIGLSIIKNIDFKIKGDIINNITGQKLYILNKLLKKNATLKLGNTNLQVPESNMKYSTTKTSKLYNRPIDQQDETLIIPIHFGFSKHPSLYLPLFLYTTEDIEIHVTLRALNEIYTVNVHDKDYWYYAKEPNVAGYTIPSSNTQFRKDAISNTNMKTIANFPTLTFGENTTYINSSNGNGSPYFLKRYESRKVTIPTITTTSQNIKYNLYSCCESQTSISGEYNISCTMETEQFFLDPLLKSKFNNLFIYSYLFDQFIEDTNITSKTYTDSAELRLNFHSPIKQLVLSIQRSDNHTRNEWLNFTNYEDASLTETEIVKFQDNWWYNSNSVTKTTVSEDVIISDAGATSVLTIIPDNFQEFIFRYGPQGEAGHIIDTSGSGFSGWPDSIKGNEQTYSIQEIDVFRNIWKYRNASEIPQINNTNFTSTWKESPLDTMEIVFHSHIREDAKNSKYYHSLQPYIHSNNNLDSGLFLYSFNIDSNPIQPTGSYKVRADLLFILNLVLNSAQSFNNVDNALTITPYALCHNIIHMKQDTFSLLYYNY
jgi:hypothetical protein